MDELLDEGINPLIATTVDDFDELLDFVIENKPFIPAAIAKVEAEKSVSRIKINQKIFKDIRNDLNKGLDKEFSNISAPVLLIWGDQDRAINAKNIDKYAELIPNASKLVLQDIGHLAMVEVPKITAQKALAFMDQAAKNSTFNKPL